MFCYFFDSQFGDAAETIGPGNQITKRPGKQLQF